MDIFIKTKIGKMIEPSGFVRLQKKIGRKKMKKVIKELYGIIWKIIRAIGLILFMEIAWLIINW